MTGDAATAELARRAQPALTVLTEAVDGGLNAALRAAQLGRRVALVEEMARGGEGSGRGKVIPLTADFYDEDAPERVASEAVRLLGHVDILIANLARPFAFKPAVEQEDAEMARLMEAIFYPLHRLVRAVLPRMLHMRLLRSPHPHFRWYWRTCRPRAPAASPSATWAR